MELRKSNSKSLCDVFDAQFHESEQLPRKFTINFDSLLVGEKWKTKVTYEGKQLGDVIDDNSKASDYYRFHDIFHFSFATMLGWSPCTRAMMKRKRKSDQSTDEHEDGARATITEEALSMIIFNEAKKKNYFDGNSKVSRTTLQIIKDMTEHFEVTVRSKKEWEMAILNAYKIFRLLVTNRGGYVEFDAINKEVSYSLTSEAAKSPTVN